MVRHPSASQDQRLRPHRRPVAVPPRPAPPAPYPAPAASPSETFSATSPASRSSSPIARSVCRCRAFDDSTIAITPNRSARATAAATADRKMPNTGRGVTDRTASMPGSERAGDHVNVAASDRSHQPAHRLHHRVPVPPGIDRRRALPQRHHVQCRPAGQRNGAIAADDARPNKPPEQFGLITRIRAMCPPFRTGAGGQQNRYGIAAQQRLSCN